MVSRRSAAVRQLGILVCTGLVISACASIPTSGAIEEGEQVRASIDDPLIRVLPRPPQDGLTREQVVTGFLAASASFDDDHLVARQFLTPKASAGWQPESGVVVYDDEVGLSSRVVGDVVSLTARETGRIGPDGAFVVREGQRLLRTFGLQRIDGEWRIARLADGLLLTELDLVRSFRSYALQFLAPDQGRLVPDPVFVPIDRSGVATSVTRALLDGPTRWLAPAVETAFPSGTELVVDAVPVENGVARVDLTAAALTASETDRERMVAQLVWSLTELPDVTGVEVTVEGAALPMPALPTVQTEESMAAFNPDLLPDAGALLMVRGGAVHRVDGDSATALSGPLGSGELAARHPASSADGALVAALVEGQRTAVLSDRFATEELLVVRRGGRMSAPSMDARGDLWLVERSGDSRRIWYKPVDADLREVTTPGLGSLRVRQLSVAMDGARAAVVANTVVDGAEEASPQLFVCRVVRVGDTVELQAPRPLAARITNVSDASWSDSQTLAILGRAAGSVRQPYEVELDGTTSEVGGAALQGIVGLTAAPGFPLVASTPDGELWQNSGVKWRALLAGSDPSYPG